MTLPTAGTAMALAATALVLPLSLLVAQRGSAYPQWGELTPGRHVVGFRVDLARDYSRRIAPPVDFEGKPNASPLEMSLPVAIWYPARVAAATDAMPYGVLAAIAAQNTDLAPVTADARRRAAQDRRSFAGFALGVSLPESLTTLIDTMRTAAMRDATPAPGRFPVLLAATDGSIAVATVLFEYLASHGIVVMAVPSRRAYAARQVSSPATVVETRVRDLEFLLDRARAYQFADTTRLAVLGANFDGMAAVAFQMKNMVSRAVVSLDGWEGKRNGASTLRGSFHYDPRRLRVPYFVVLQDERASPPMLQLDRSIFDDLVYADRHWLVLANLSHGFLTGNPLAFPSLPPERRASYELLVRTVHAFLASAFDTTGRSPAPDVQRIGGAEHPRFVRDAARRGAYPPVPDDEELERLVMVDRDVAKVERILREGRRRDSTFQLFTEQIMALYAFRFARQNDQVTATRLLALNAAAYPRSWNAASALGDAYLGAADTTRALDAYDRALVLLSSAPSEATTNASDSRSRSVIEERVARLRAGRRP